MASQSKQYTALYNFETTVLKSLDPAKKLGGIAGVPKLLEEYPNQNFRQSLFTKLSSHFTDTDKTKRDKRDNRIRVQFVKVFELCEKYFVENDEEDDDCFNRVINDIAGILGKQNNDPYARTLSLRALGYMHSLLATDRRLNVQHWILERFVSPEEAEAKAAINTADKICAKCANSETLTKFPEFLFKRAQKMVIQDHVSSSVKLQLIMIFRHMHGNIELTKQSNTICRKLLNKYDSEEMFVLKILRTLTILSNRARVLRASQIELLFKYILNDPREKVKSWALTDLTFLIRENGQIENDLLPKNIANRDSLGVTRILELFNLLGTATDTIIIKVLRLITIDFRRTFSFQKLISLHSGDIFEKFRRVLYHCIYLLENSNSKVCLAVAGLFTVMINEMSRINAEGSIEISPEFVKLFQELPVKTANSVWTSILLLSSSTNHDQGSDYVLKQACEIYIINLLGFHESQYLIEELLRQVLGMLIKVEDDLASILQKFLSKFASQHAPYIKNQAKDIISNSNLDIIMQRPKIFTNLMKITLKASFGTWITVTQRTALVNNVIANIRKFGGWNNEHYTQNKWYLYLIAKEAAITGCFEIMSDIMNSLATQVESDSSSRFLKALKTLAQVELSVLEITKGATESATKFEEYLLNFDFITKLYRATEARLMGDTKMVFQEWFCNLRMEFLNCIYSLLGILNAAIRHGKIESYGIVCLILAYSIQSMLIMSETTSNYDWSILWQAHQQYLNSLNSTTTPSQHRAEKLTSFLFDRSIQFLVTLKNPEKGKTVPRQKQQGSSLSNRRKSPISINTITTLRNFLIEILSIPLSLPPLFFVIRKAEWINSMTTKPSYEALIQALRNRRPEYFDWRIKLTFQFEGSLQLPNIKIARRNIRYVKVFIFGSIENLDYYDRKRALERKKELEVCYPLETEVDVENGSFKCILLVNWLDNPNDGYFNVHIEAIDDNEVAWTIGPDLTFPVYFRST
ncbi:3838_t:CDS:10 [Ambispora leptoticha]|uniref:3838_t:CDS:1 n=1 Tax=Ambispora leptoticha TaxID=144679 RepID=A0A9N9CQ04_9GLOM|nr:3838_t:CDS:10 [Ambispora leptoticha]